MKVVYEPPVEAHLPELYAAHRVHSSRVALLTDAAYLEYETEGFLLLESLFHLEQIQAAQAELEAIEALLGETPRLFQKMALLKPPQGRKALAPGSRLFQLSAGNEDSRRLAGAR